MKNLLYFLLGLSMIIRCFEPFSWKYLFFSSASIIVFYKILFYALTPIIITMSPAIPYIITNNGAYLLGLFITLPLGTTLAMKFWDYSNLEDKQPTNQQTTPTEESKSINQIKI